MLLLKILHIQMTAACLLETESQLNNIFSVIKFNNILSLPNFKLNILIVH